MLEKIALRRALVVALALAAGRFADAQSGESLGCGVALRRTLVITRSHRVTAQAPLGPTGPEPRWRLSNSGRLSNPILAAASGKRYLLISGMFRGAGASARAAGGADFAIRDSGAQTWRSDRAARLTPQRRLH